MTADHQAVPRIELAGPARERGRRYGEAAASRIAVSVACYGEMFAIAGMDWKQVAERARPLEAVIERAFPEALEEIDGIAAGSGISYDTLLAMNARTELLPPDYRARVAAATGMTPAADGAINECTSFALAPAGAGGREPGPPVWLAQNWDWLGGQRDALVLLDVVPERGPRYLTVTEAGMLAKIGCNERGLGVTLNILRSFDDGRRPGMPVHILLRALLSCESVAQGLEFARAQAHYTSSSNVLMADASGAMVSLECSPRGLRELPPRDGRLWHTNHFVDPEQASFDANLAGDTSTIARYVTATELLTADAGQFDLAAVKRVLSDESADIDSICRFPDPALPPAAQVETVTSVIMDLASRELWVSPAQPSLGGFARYSIAGGDGATAPGSR